ncbi:polyhydroxyalkanoic acid system family protein [Azospirillum sp. ST 5-10]|uniref:polyhydroxyalkanoic acid system family protein n=1 Tax=unclassified Azospirillum TaxID=2630922 RepID=UPI003F4A4B41
MPKPVVVTIPHQLGREEAQRRLRNGLETARGQLSTLNAAVEETWTEHGLNLRVVALGQTIDSRVHVADDHARVEVDLPWMLAMLAEKVGAKIRKHGVPLLTKS